jgi:subtilase family serine protease
VRFVSILLACFATAFAIPAGAAVLRPMAARLPVAAARPMTLAATRGAFAGEVSPAESISILVRLQGQHENELAQFLATLQNPGNGNPRYLTPGEFGRYFGADPLTYGRAIAALRAAGFVIDDTFENRTDIAAHAPAMRVAAFFGTPIDRRFERGRLFFTARYEPQIPAALGNATISGLDDYVQFHPIGLRRPSGHVQGGSWTPDDIAAGYNIAPLYAKGLDGSGVTIANSTAGAANASDVKIFQQHFGLPVVPMLSKGVGGALSPSCGRSCDNSESSLDVASATSVARGATFYQVVAHTPSNHNFDLSYEFIVNKLATNVHVVTTSWGLCEREFNGTKSKKIDETLMAQAAAEGQFWFSASGDNGTDDCENGSSAVSADFPGTSPFVISVGGTNVQGTTDGSGRVTGWAGESTWQYANSDGASGGGKSIFYAKPVYQNGVTPNDGARDVPDVALLADNINDGVWLCRNAQMQSDWGGTSEAAPMWAAFLAIVEQSKNKSGKTLVDPHRRLYALAKSGKYSSLFHDVLTGNNGVPANDDPYNKSFPGFNAGQGFDLATGWGSFNGAPLLAAY